MKNKFQIFAYGSLFLILSISCTRNNQEKNQNSSQKPGSLLLKVMESEEDSLEISLSLEAQSKFQNIIYADAETEPVVDAEDAADDPAIWVNKKFPSKSLILGTNKKGGLYVYDLGGNVLQYLKIGNINNVDLRDGFKFNGNEVVLVAGSNRSNNSISLLYLNKETGILSDTVMNIKSAVDEIYGICLYHSQVNNGYYVFVNGKDGLVEQWKITHENKFEASLIKSFTLPDQPEGMVANDRTGILYMGVEDKAIFKAKIESEGPIFPTVVPESDSFNSNISYDLEGLAIFTYNNKDYLIASSQGNFSYAIFELSTPEKYITSFVISSGSIIDGVEETDGLDVNTAFFNTLYPKGILVVQDGFNFDGDSLKTQNFKIISLDKVLMLL